MLESGARRRLLQIPNVRLQDECDVTELGFDRSLGRVTGVRVRHRGCAAGAKTIGADLVVDASGRGSQAPAWLETFGYARPREESIKINIGYMTRHYRRRPEHLATAAAIPRLVSEPCI
jgi:hypothetical protein